MISVNQAATSDVMNRVGIHWPEAHKDSSKMAKLSLATQMYNRFENVRVPFDQTVEAEALGATIRYGGELEFPEVSSPLASASDLRVSGDIITSGRIPVVLDAISELQNDAECEAPIVSGIVGPYSVVAQSCGLERTLRWSVKSPEIVTQAMEKVTPFLISYAREQVRRGADYVSVEDMASSPDMISPKFFSERVSKHLGTLIEAIDAPVMLHICGNATQILERMVELHPAVIHLDAKTDLRKARQVSYGKTKVAGNLSPVTTLLRGSLDEVDQAVVEAVSMGVDLIAPGCSLSPLTPAENIAAVIAAAKRLEPKKRSYTAVPARDIELYVNYEVARLAKIASSQSTPSQQREEEHSAAREPILNALSVAVVKGDVDEVVRYTRTALEKYDPPYVIQNGLTAGIQTVSKMWDNGEYFLPEVITASDALQAGVKLCEKAMNRAYDKKGKVITFVPEGDIHDIGKNIVVSFLNAAGFEVLDLGKNVKDDVVVRAVKVEKPLLICGSALMTTTMSAFPRIAESLGQQGLDVPLAIGGGAVTQEFAESFPLGVYGEKANDAVVAAELARKGIKWRDMRTQLAATH